MGQDSYKLTVDAICREELDELLLGVGTYAYLPKYSPSPAKTDPTILMTAGFYEVMRKRSDLNVRKALTESLMRLARTYAGLWPVAVVLLVEALHQSRGDSPLNLDLQALADELKPTIARSLEKLREDHTGPGQSWPRGMLDELRNLNQNTIDHGGPSYFDTSSIP